MRDLTPGPGDSGAVARKHRADTWKSHERACAKRLGAQRVGPSGTSTADCVNDHLAIECKMRASLPAWLHAAMAQAVQAARGAQTPICVLHELGQRHDADFVVLRLKDFEDLWGTIWKKREA